MNRPLQDLYSQTTAAIIISEAPGFPGSLAAMESCGAQIVGIEMDENGMMPNSLRATLAMLIQKGERVKFIYTIPEFQNPSGRTMDLERRRAIIEIGAEFEIPILEDQPYRELRFEGERIITGSRTSISHPGVVWSLTHADPKTYS